MCKCLSIALLLAIMFCGNVAFLIILEIKLRQTIILYTIIKLVTVTPNVEVIHILNKVNGVENSLCYY